LCANLESLRPSFDSSASLARISVSSSLIGSSLSVAAAITAVLTGVGGGAFVPTAGLDVVDCARLHTSGVLVPAIAFWFDWNEVRACSRAHSAIDGVDLQYRRRLASCSRPWCQELSAVR
jgi:hypothetical protein